MALARIFRPARSAATSGAAKTGKWMLEFERQAPRTTEPLMGYTSSSDMLSQVQIEFDSRDDAVDYAEREGIAYRVEEPKAARKHRRSYAENFSYARKQPWTH